MCLLVKFLMPLPGYDAWAINCFEKSLAAFPTAPLPAAGLITGMLFQPFIIKKKIVYALNQWFFGAYQYQVNVIT